VRVSERRKPTGVELLGRLRSSGAQLPATRASAADRERGKGAGVPVRDAVGGAGWVCGAGWKVRLNAQKILAAAMHTILGLVLGTTLCAFLWARYKVNNHC
jgi:hypothetical protein